MRLIQVHFSPLSDREWKSKKIIDIVSSRYPKFIKRMLLSRYAWILKVSGFLIYALFKMFTLLAQPTPTKKGKHDERESISKKAAEALERKFE